MHILDFFFFFCSLEEKTEKNRKGKREEFAGSTESNQRKAGSQKDERKCLMFKKGVAEKGRHSEVRGI